MTAHADADYVELERRVLQLEEREQAREERVARLELQRGEDSAQMRTLIEKVDRLDGELSQFAGRFDRKLDRILAAVEAQHG
ncbi:MAG: hypothetical protein DI536_04295 [Archangium gephyra]|uniref:Uncharacterized protein n=1 Tax=Archangium gephyra TaxID=48 RepID=A0A2W5TPN6_9BACT|nr:MAG: hypothetical protein DI536_04295 [Archangium gephyra]